ncbi:MAG: hypothetical protein RR280_05695 [Bacteroidaceae bacterium]
MKKYYLFTTIIFLFTLSSYAQKTRIIIGLVENSVNNEPLSGTQVFLMNASDSSIVDSTSSKYAVDNGRPKSQFGFKIKKEGRFLLCLKRSNYDTVYKELTILKNSSKSFMDVGTIRMKVKKEIELKDAKIKATRIKIYNRGDTVIYNADAFNLADGSMLDALIRQMPGAVLTSDGRITLNGKQIESLLLNGKDFFSGDNNVMLNNLPSYMVDRIKIYENKNTSLGNLGSKSLTMDVNLKKQYSIGMLGNIELGKGNFDRYMARYFMLRFTPQSRVSMFVSINNLNDSRIPGQDGGWGERMNEGHNATKQLGIDYNVEDHRKRYEVSGSAQLSHLDKDNYTHTNSVNFISGGDTYGYGNSSSESCETSISTSNHIKLNVKKLQLDFPVKFSYNRKSSNYSNTSALLQQNFPNLSNKEVLDSMFSQNTRNMIRKAAINATSNKNLDKGYDISAEIALTALLMIKTNQALYFMAGTNYEANKRDYYSHYQLDYPSNPNSKTDFRNQYGKTPFTKNINKVVSLNYIHFFTNNIEFRPIAYFYEYNYKGTYDFYRLDHLEGWGQNTEHKLGRLPSVTDYMQTLDKSNSYVSNTTFYIRGGDFKLCWNQEEDKKKGFWNIEATIPIAFHKTHYKYTRAEIDTVVSREIFLFSPNAKIKYVYDKKNRDIWFNYNMETHPTSITYFIDNYRDDSDPLNIVVHKVKLKEAQEHKVSTGYSYQNIQKQHFLNCKAEYTTTANQIAMNSFYNSKTGARTSYPDNVNGNWRLYTTANYSTPLDSFKRLVLQTNSSITYNKSIDLMTIENSIYNERSKVSTMWLSESIKLNYNQRRLKVGANAGGTWTLSESKREGFSRISAVDFNYGLTAQLDLPWSMQIGTDFTVYSRRGYNEKEMNTNDLIWNARISKKIMKGKLTFLLDGFDMLGQLSSITRTVNAQGRTETYRTVMPSYVMLHAIYRLDIKPKKKPGEK